MMCANVDVANVVVAPFGGGCGGVDCGAVVVVVEKAGDGDGVRWWCHAETQW